MANLSKARLTDSNGGSVVFDFNPTSLTIERMHDGFRRDSGERPWLADTQMQITGFDPTKLKLSDVVFEGPSTRENVNRLEQWLEPDWEISRQVKDRKVWMLPKLRFEWGPEGLNEDVEMASLSATFTRFTPGGMPVRANVGIALHVMYMDLRATNPTSGGLPGRRAVTLVQGQSLQALALDHYGSPAHWRPIARLNGVEDPLRVRPGTAMYLPNRDELHQDGAE